MKKLLLLSTFILTLSLFGQSTKPFFFANFPNKNVWKTQDTLKIKLLYKDNKKIRVNSNAKISEKDTFKLIVPSNYLFVRYKVLLENDKKTYIRILKGCNIDFENKTVEPSYNNKVEANDYIFEIAESKMPLNSYEASSALIGKLITIPVRFRSLDNSIEVEPTFEVGYAFGWKFKLGNNPFKSHYLSFIPYATSIGTQKYFTRLAEGVFSEKKDELAFNYWSFGVSYEWEKLNLGLFAGQDIMFGDKKDWVYQDDWWIGIGFGYDLIKSK